MKLTTLLLILLPVVVFTCVSPLRSAAAEGEVIFSDTFADVNGHALTNTDGKVEGAGQATRRLFTFMGPAPTNALGKLAISILEDPVTKGFDQNPGLLAMSFQSIPSDASYCGFVYLGGLSPDRGLALKEITGAPTLATLKQLKLKFRYMGSNSLKGMKTGAIWGCRLEPLIDSAYSSRIAFQPLKATDKWQTFEVTLDRGENVENFLKTVAATPPNSFKIVWSQVGPIGTYQPGDTLLIDDIEVSRIMSPTKGKK